MSHFDQSAATWDANPIHFERSNAIAEQIIRKIPLHKGMSALEFGAGTGILSFLLKDYIREITLMDSSREMVRVIEEKIRNTNLTHMEPVFFDLETTDYRAKTFDLIFTQMVLHHIEDVEAIINKFYLLLNAGGSIVIADLYPEDGTFHSHKFTGHFGFNLEDLTQLLDKAGFSNITHEQCFIIRKQIANGDVRDFPVFILTAAKS